jgi:AraC-like DNA-binding protein
VAEGISAADILPMLGGSRRAAEKRFRAATGKSILEEILDVRFQKLMPLLEQGHIPLASLADLTGFSSENHLQRQFKSRFGMTLSAYRKKQHS